MKPLPVRSGPRPRTTATNPHQQLDQNPPVEMFQELLERLFGLPDVVERPSAVSVPGARALWLAPEHARGPADAFMAPGEFAHVHPFPDGSLHVALPPGLGDEAIRNGWAEQHPVARAGWIPANVCMIYAPKNEEELTVVVGLVESAYGYAHR